MIKDIIIGVLVLLLVVACALLWGLNELIKAALGLRKR